MAIPDYQTLMLPLLRFAADKQEHSLRQAIEAVASEFQLTESERNELLPSGQDITINNRVRWARFYMGKAGLLESTSRGFFRISDRGLLLLESKPAKIEVSLLENYPEFRELKERRNEPGDTVATDPPDHLSAKTPEELIEAAHEDLESTLAGEILDALKASSPSFFEQAVIDVLVAMGYGGTRRDAGEAIGRSGDGGIDGVIREDRLGLDAIFVQAKRWDSNAVGRPDVQRFAGALQGQKARKGIMITTSSFSKEAVDFAKNIESRIILIDGPQLARYMIDFGVGVTTIASYTLKRLDSDYFSQ